MKDCSNFPKIFFDLLPGKGGSQKQSPMVLATNFINAVGDTIQLKLTTSHLELYSQYSETSGFVFQGGVLLDLDLSYQIMDPCTVILQVIQGYGQQTVSGIRFRRGNKKGFEVFSQSQKDIGVWKARLLELIPQFGFDSQYKIASRIGKGTFSEVYHAVNIVTKERTAVKLFKKSVINQSSTKRELLESEIKMLRKLNHPNVTQLLGVYESDENYYILMKLVRGGQLAYKIQSKQKFNPSQIKTFIKKLLEGLEYIHSKGIIHRDIKPQNIMFNEDNEPVIVDFGFATEINAQTNLYRCGTVGFMPPEILKLRSIPKTFNPVWDVFSAGVIFYMMLFRESPFQGKSSVSLIKQGVAWTPYSIQLYQNQYTKGTIDLLTKMLDQNPSSRISSEESLSHPYFEEQDIVIKDQSNISEDFSLYQSKNILSLNHWEGKENRVTPEAKTRFLERRFKNKG